LSVCANAGMFVLVKMRLTGGRDPILQVLGKVPTISIDKTDGCQMYLSPESLDVEIVSSKSSEMNVLVPKGNGDYTEYPIPEQYKTTVVPGKGLSTVIIENKG
jgi:adenylyl cyclase-associated protein